AAEKKQRREQRVEFFQEIGVALELKTNLALGAVAGQTFKPVESVLDRLVERVGGEWFGEIGVGADLQTVDLVCLIGQGRGHNDRDKVRFAVELERFADGISVDVRQHEIEQDHGRLVFPHPIDHVFAFEKKRGLVTPAAQMLRQNQSKFLFIIDNQGLASHDAPRNGNVDWTSI